MLNEFNEGGSHSENPLGGIPQGMGQNGMMNTVEEGETKKSDFIYSDRIVFTPDVVAQFNLPKSLTGKTSAEASKIINKKFDGRNDKITNSTKKSMLDKVAEAQETIKQMQAEEINQAMQMNSQEVPDMMEGQVPQGMEEFAPQNQMFAGGELTSVLGAAGASGALGQHTGINQLTTAADLGQTAFGKTGIDTSGATNVDPGSIKPGMMGVQGAMKGAQAGMMFGPWGAAIGGAVGLTAGLVGGNRAKKDALKGQQNFQIGESNKMISNFAFGGNLGDPKTDPKTIPTVKTGIKTEIVEADSLPGLHNSRLMGPIHEIQPGSDKNGQGNFIYYKPRTTPGFNRDTDREFVSDKNMNDIYRSREYLTYMANRQKQAALNRNPELTQPLPLNSTNTFRMGGNMYSGGGPFDKSMSSYDPTKINLGLSQQEQKQNISLLDNLEYVKNLNNPNKGMFYKQFFGQNLKNKQNPYSNPLNYETNKIKNYHDALGITSDTPGYGTAWGDKSNTAMFQHDVKRIPNDEQIIRMQKENKTKYSSTKEDILNGKFLKRNERWGLTPEGSKYIGPKSTYYTDMGKNIPNDLGFESKLNYSESPNESSARTFGPQGGHSTQAEIKNVTDQIGTGLNKAGQFIKDNKGALRYAPVAMNAFQLHKLNKEGYDTVNPIINNTRYNPQYMDEKSLTNQINAESNYAGNALANASNGSMGALSNSILASQLNKTRGLSDAYSKVADVNRNENKAGQQFNLSVDEANIGRRIGAEDRTAMNKGAFKTEQSKLRGQIGTDLGEIGKEELYKDMAKKLYGYDFNGKYYVAPDGTKKTTQEMADMIDADRDAKNNKTTFKTNKFNPMNFEDGIVFKSKYN